MVGKFRQKLPIFAVWKKFDSLTPQIKEFIDIIDIRINYNHHIRLSSQKPVQIKKRYYEQRKL